MTEKYIVTVAGSRGNYKVKCKGKRDLKQYLKALKENEPYFQLVQIKEGTS